MYKYKCISSGAILASGVIKVDDSLIKKNPNKFEKLEGKKYKILRPVRIPPLLEFELDQDLRALSATYETLKSDPSAEKFEERTVKTPLSDSLKK